MCGICCSNIRRLIEQAKGGEHPFAKEMVAFPYGTKEDGSCEKLIDNKCSVYDSRPDICSVDRVYEKYLKGKATKKEWYDYNEDLCKQAIYDRDSKQPVAVS